MTFRAPSARWFLPFTIALALVGCGASSSNTGGTTGDAAAVGNGASSDPDGGVAPGGASRPSPGPAPSTATGFFVLSYGRSKGATTKFQATGMFRTPPENMATPGAAAMLSGYASVPLDTCLDLGTIPTVETSGNSTLMDGGEVRVTTPAKGDVAVAKTNIATFVLYNGELPLDAFVDDGAYTLTVQGAGAIKAFHGQFWAPRALTVKAPLPSSGTLAVSRSKPLDVSWTPTGDGEPALVSLSQQGRTVLCRVTDDGAFTIPTKTLASFSAADPTSADPSNPDQLSVLKQTWYAMGTSEGTPTLVFFHTGDTFDISFE